MVGDTEIQLEFSWNGLLSRTSTCSLDCLPRLANEYSLNIQLKSPLKCLCVFYVDTHGQRPL